MTFLLKQGNVKSIYTYTDRTSNMYMMSSGTLQSNSLTASSCWKLIVGVSAIKEVSHF
jgi:hypothetical protein